MNTPQQAIGSLIVAAAATLIALAPAAAATRAAGAAVDNRMLSNEADGRNWASFGRTFSEDHYSPLKQIDAKSVGKLGLAWHYDLRPMASVYSAPLEVDGVLYFAVGYSVVHAMDARSGKLLWQYDPHAPEVAGHKLRGGWGTRGIAFWKGKVYTATHDGRLIALDARTGKPVWSVMTTDPNDTRYITAVPWVFNGKVVIGHGGGDFEPVRGYITCYDAETGRQLWRFYTVPGNPKDGYENDTVAMAAKTWKGEWWRFGGAGGTVWGGFAYDPQLNRLYFGTGNGLPWNERIRAPGGGDNLFLASIVAVDADTGKYVWHYQEVPSDVWDYDADTDIEMATLTLKGERVPVLMQASKNGFFYVIDRRNGKLLTAEKFAKATWADRIDLATGRPVETPNARYAGEESRLIFPGPIGAHATQAMSFNPATGLVYIPSTDVGGLYADPPDYANYQIRPNMAVNPGLAAGKNPPAVPRNKVSLVAWNPATQSQAWSVPLQGTSVNGATMTSAGNLVFQGQVTGEFTAYAADSGKKLWGFDAQTAVIAQPITYMLDGKQYVTVIAGWRGMGSSSGLPVEWEYRQQPRRVLTFALEGKDALPPAAPRSTPFVDDANFAIDPQKAAIGAALTGRHCTLCHGGGLASGGTAPDLRKSQIPLSREALTAVLHDGQLVPLGMPKFDEFTPEQIEGIQHFIRQKARDALTAAAAAPSATPPAAAPAAAR